MGISRLIYGRSAMKGLYLQSDNWCEEHNITSWLNTQVAHINDNEQHVLLATGDTLAYDRLILSTGSRSFVPPIEGFGLPGSFVLHEAEDAMAMTIYSRS